VSDAFEDLVRRHQVAVCATAYAVLRDRARSEEIAQDAFLVAWRKLPAMDPAPPLPAWICGVARNLARNAARKRHEAPMTDDEVSGGDSPLETTLRREHADLANRALAALPDADRELVVLFYRYDESIADVSRSLAIPEATTRKRLQRTRERLRDALASVEAMLRATRPGPAFTIGCVAALAAGRVVDASAATSTSRAGIGAKVALGTGVIAVIVAGVSISRVTSTPTSTQTSGSTSASTSASTSRSSPSTSSATSSPRAPQALPASIRRISAADRAALLERIRARRASGAAIESRIFDFSAVSVDTPPASTLPLDDSPIPTLTKSTLRRAISRLHPMLRACAGAAAHGRLAVKLRIVAEPRGTVVESVEITGDPPLADDADFVECVRTTLESLELPPTNEAVPWDVHYPFTF
jgi:RNA polymerase sigma factor (sigma-70 family)